ncbi:hypothetical protein H9P43_006906 [Blastocladiella emersonii ATCC 22665]|nr:hypothetical protein H9P43_006906 [Blastocladiella emersonii ATCC 22665]
MASNPTTFTISPALCSDISALPGTCSAAAKDPQAVPAARARAAELRQLLAEQFAACSAAINAAAQPAPSQGNGTSATHPPKLQAQAAKALDALIAAHSRYNNMINLAVDMLPAGAPPAAPAAALPAAPAASTTSVNKQLRADIESTRINFRHQTRGNCRDPATFLRNLRDLYPLHDLYKLLDAATTTVGHNAQVVYKLMVREGAGLEEHQLIAHFFDHMDRAAIVRYLDLSFPATLGLTLERHCVVFVWRLREGGCLDPTGHLPPALLSLFLNSVKGIKDDVYNALCHTLGTATSKRTPLTLVNLIGPHGYVQIASRSKAPAGDAGNALSAVPAARTKSGDKDKDKDKNKNNNNYNNNNNNYNNYDNKNNNNYNNHHGGGAHNKSSHYDKGKAGRDDRASHDALRALLAVPNDRHNRDHGGSDERQRSRSRSAVRERAPRNYHAAVAPVWPAGLETKFGG